MLDEGIGLSLGLWKPVIEGSKEPLKATSYDPLQPFVIRGPDSLPASATASRAILDLMDQWRSKGFRLSVTTKLAALGFAGSDG